MAKAKGKAATVIYSPHIKGTFSVEMIMWNVVLALLPAGVAGVCYFGYHALRVIIISVITALITEFIMNKLLKSEITIFDGSAFITGLLFAYNLPPMAPWYVVVVGSAFSIAIVKWAFGGLGQNFMNPALGGRIFIMAAWSNIMIGKWSPTITQYINSHPILLSNINTEIITNSIGKNFSIVTNYLTNIVTNHYSFIQASAEIVKNDALSGATPLNILKTGGMNAVSQFNSFNYWNLFIGNVPGCIGETSALAILLGCIYLVVRKIIIPDIPFVYIGTVALLTWIFGGIPHGTGFFTGDPLYHILSGGLFLGACFMANDMVTSPLTIKGNIIYAIGCGILTTIIRLWGGYPEGVSYAIVLMNIFVPLIDRYTKGKIYGYK